MDTIPNEILDVIVQDMPLKDLTRFLMTTKWLRYGVSSEYLDRAKWFAKLYKSHSTINASKYREYNIKLYGEHVKVSARLYNNYIITYEGYPGDDLSYGFINISDPSKAAHYRKWDWVLNEDDERCHKITSLQSLLLYDMVRNADYFRVIHLPRDIIDRIASYLSPHDILSFLMMSVDTMHSYDYLMLHSCNKNMSKMFAKRYPDESYPDCTCDSDCEYDDGCDSGCDCISVHDRDWSDIYDSDNTDVLYTHRNRRSYFIINFIYRPEYRRKYYTNEIRSLNTSKLCTDRARKSKTTYASCIYI